MPMAIRVSETEADTPDSIARTDGDQIQRMAEAGADSATPSLFKMKVALPRQGRGHAFLAATDRMTVVLKSYAADGENKLHGHVNEDHTFIVMQGKARFTDPQGESVVLGKHDGILIPRRALYTFMTEGDEPLVLLRVGCVVDAARPPWGRVDAHGQPVRGGDRENNTVPTVFLEGRYFE